MPALSARMAPRSPDCTIWTVVASCAASLSAPAPVSIAAAAAIISATTTAPARNRRPFSIVFIASLTFPTRATSPGTARTVWNRTEIHAAGSNYVLVLTQPPPSTRCRRSDSVPSSQSRLSPASRTDGCASRRAPPTPPPSPAPAHHAVLPPERHRHRPRDLGGGGNHVLCLRRVRAGGRPQPEALWLRPRRRRADRRHDRAAGSGTGGDGTDGQRQLVGAGVARAVSAHHPRRQRRAGPLACAGGPARR